MLNIYFFSPWYSLKELINYYGPLVSYIMTCCPLGKGPAERKRNYCPSSTLLGGGMNNSWQPREAGGVGSGGPLLSSDRMMALRRISFLNVGPLHHNTLFEWHIFFEISHVDACLWEGVRARDCGRHPTSPTWQEIWDFFPATLQTPCHKCDPSERIPKAECNLGQNL